MRPLTCRDGKLCDRKKVTCQLEHGNFILHDDFFAPSIFFSSFSSPSSFEIKMCLLPFDFLKLPFHVAGSQCMKNAIHWVCSAAPNTILNSAPRKRESESVCVWKCTEGNRERKALGTTVGKSAQEIYIDFKCSFKRVCTRGLWRRNSF